MIDNVFVHPYSSWSLHSHRGNRNINPVPGQQSWRIWVNSTQVTEPRQSADRIHFSWDILRSNHSSYQAFHKHSHPHHLKLHTKHFVIRTHYNYLTRVMHVITILILNTSINMILKNVYHYLRQKYFETGRKSWSCRRFYHCCWPLTEQYNFDTRTLFVNSGKDERACSTPIYRYRKTSNISRTLIGNKTADPSDVVIASPVDATPTTSSFSTWHLASRDSAKKAARQYKNL